MKSQEVEILTCSFVVFKEFFGGWRGVVFFHSLYVKSTYSVFVSGRSYCVRTQRMLNQCLESLVQKVQSGVVINFEKSGPDPPLIGEGELHADPHLILT